MRRAIEALHPAAPRRTDPARAKGVTTATARGLEAREHVLGGAHVREESEARRSASGHAEGARRELLEARAELRQEGLRTLRGRLEVVREPRTSLAERQSLQRVGIEA